MSNRDPNITGITKYWKEGRDARCLLLRELVSHGYPDGLETQKIIDDFLDAVMAVVDSNEKSVFVGIGTFKWCPWTAKNPLTHKKVKTWHLSFKPCRYREGKYNGKRRPGRG